VIFIKHSYKIGPSVGQDLEQKVHLLIAPEAASNIETNLAS